ncbi:hypothetical protein L7F22_047511 [Adiantum nelumboides]|nr:hypothetical protein [Adiantum nelumboides]
MKSLGETSKRRLSTAREGENPYQELQNLLLEDSHPSRRRGHAQHEEPPSKEKERIKSPDESIEDDMAPRRRAQRSPTPTKRKRSAPRSPPHDESKREEKDSKKKKERKRSPSSNESGGYSSKKSPRRGHRRSHVLLGEGPISSKCGEQGHSYRTCPQRNDRNEQSRASIIEAPKEDVHYKGSLLSYAWGKVRERDAFILFDPGSTHNFISLELANKLGIQDFEMEDAMNADGAFIGQDVFVTPLIGKLRLHIQGYVDNLDFFMSPLKHEDVILEAPWFDRLAASIKFPERKISFKFGEKDMYINAQESGSSIPLVNDQAFDKSIKSSISAYMIFVKDSLSDANKTQVNESGMNENLELSKFLNQFQDVFIDDLPGELPPKRGDDDHAIKLLPSSSPPNKPPYRVSQTQQEEIMRQVNELVEKGMVIFRPHGNFTGVDDVIIYSKSTEEHKKHLQDDKEEENDSQDRDEGPSRHHQEFDDDDHPSNGPSPNSGEASTTPPAKPSQIPLGEMEGVDTEEELSGSLLGFPSLHHLLAAHLPPTALKEASRLLRGYNGRDLVPPLQLPERTISTGKDCKFDVQVNICFLDAKVYVIKRACMLALRLNLSLVKR